MRRRSEPYLYLRGRVWWCYWDNERWSTKTEDHGEATRRVHEKYDPRHKAARRVTIEDAFTLLTEALVRRGRSEATRSQAEQKLGHFVRLWPMKPLGEISHTTLMAYIDKRRSEYVNKSKTKHVSRLTVSHELSYLRQAWKLAGAQGWTTRRWDELMPERFDRGYVPRKRWLTAAELALVLNDLSDERAAWVAWIVATGSDVSDVARAEPADIDWKRGLVRVRGTKTRFRDRLVPITKLTRPLLKLAAEFGPPFLDWQWCNLALKRCAVRVGVEHFTPKDLRRTHGQWLRHAGVEPHLIGRVLGHADSKMAENVYGQGDEELLARLVRARTNVVRISHNSRKNHGSQKH